MLTAIINTLLAIPLAIPLIILCVMGLIIVGTIFWIWMLIDCVINKRISDSQKVAWIVTMIFTHMIGALLYLFLGRSGQKIQNTYQPYVRQQAPYYPYQQGYQAAPPPPYQQGAAPTVPYEQQASLDYEQPQAMYPHEQNDA
jgi:hypothetical protein